MSDPTLFPAVPRGSIVDARGYTWSVSTVSEGSPNGGWDPGFDATSTVRRSGMVAEVAVENSLIVAHELCARPLLLDPAAAVLWRSFDGSVSLGTLAEDVADVLGGTVASQLEQLTRWAISLAELGFVEAPRPPTPPLPRRLDPPLPADSCVGKRVGLGRSLLREVTIGGEPAFRFGSSDVGLVEELEALLPSDVTVADPTGAWVPTYVLRAPRGRTMRLQQLFNTTGDVLYATRDSLAASEALTRTVAALLEVSRPDRAGGGVTWFDGPAIAGPSGVCLLHPGLRDWATGDGRVELESAGLRLLPSALMMVGVDESGPVVRLPADPRQPSEVSTAPLVAVVTPANASEALPEATRVMSHSVHRWEPHSLDILPALGQLHRGVGGEVDPARILAMLCDASPL